MKTICFGLGLALTTGCAMPLQVSVTPVYQTNYVTEVKTVWVTNIVSPGITWGQVIIPAPGSPIWLNKRDSDGLL